MKRIQAREEVCIGCGLCSVYCRTEHSVSKDIIKAHNKEKPSPLPRLRIERKEEVSFAVQCRHCDEPWCVCSCLTGAMTKDSLSGIVASDPDKCSGCWTCLVACPYGALAKDRVNKIVVKCDLCPGREIPACVANCPNEALILLASDEG